ncbi:urotensin-2 receptor-like [Arapaima gigas]
MAAAWSADNSSAAALGNSSPAAPLADSGGDVLLVTCVLGTILMLMCVVGMAGNIYTLVVVNVSVRLTGSMYVYIVNLALADLLYLSTIPFVVSTYLAQDWYFGDVGCRVIFSLDFLTMHASIFILTIMSTERYLAVVNPLDTLSRSRSYRRSVTCAVWLVSFLLALPTMIMIELKRDIRDGLLKRMCHPTWQIGAYKVYLTVLFNTCILAPGCIMGCLYLRLARTYWVSQHAMFADQGTSRSPKQKVFYMIFSIVLAYWACFLPFWLWQLLSIYYLGHGILSHRVMVYVNLAVTCLAYSNSCINPFLYTLLAQNYRERVHGRHKELAGSACRFRPASQRSVSSASHHFTDMPTIVHLGGVTDGCSVGAILGELEMLSRL